MAMPKYARGYPKSNNLNPQSICQHKPKILPSPFKNKRLGCTAQRKDKKVWVALTGGPFDEEKVLLTEGSTNTLPISTGKHRGIYTVIQIGGDEVGKKKKKKKTEKSWVGTWVAEDVDRWI